jgi:hypothetical protein
MTDDIQSHLHRVQLSLFLTVKLKPDSEMLFIDITMQ